MLETIHDHWQLLAGLLAINLVFLVAGIGWPRRPTDIREHPQWPEVRVLVDRYVAIALPDPDESGGPFSPPEAAERHGASDDLGDFFHNRPPAYVPPEADDAVWAPVPSEPEPASVERQASAPYEAADPSQIAFAFAETGGHERDGAGATPAAEPRAEPQTFLEWFAERERHRLETAGSGSAGTPAR